MLWSSVFRYTTILIPCQNLQYSVITEINMIITVTEVTILEMNLTLSEDQEVLGIDQSFVKVLLMLNMDKCFISRYFVTIVCKL